MAKNARRGLFEDWLAEATTVFAPRLVFQQKSSIAFFAFFIGNEHLALRYDAFGIGGANRRLNRAVLEMCSDEGLGGDVNYEYDFGLRRFISVGTTVIDHTEGLARSLPRFSQEQILIPLKAIPFRRFDLRLVLTGDSRCSVQATIDLDRSGLPQAE